MLLRTPSEERCINDFKGLSVYTTRAKSHVVDRHGLNLAHDKIPGLKARLAHHRHLNHDKRHGECRDRGRGVVTDFGLPVDYDTSVEQFHATW